MPKRSATGPGSSPTPPSSSPANRWSSSEGEFDALLLGQELHDLAAVVTLGSASSRPDLATRAEMLAAAPWFIATDADKAGDKAASGWPASAIRVRPPEGVKDWTELWQAGRNAIRYFWGRYLPMSAPWEELAALRWGPALNDQPEPPEDGPDPYTLAEREAIQQENAPPAHAPARR